MVRVGRCSTQHGGASADFGSSTARTLITQRHEPLSGILKARGDEVVTAAQNLAEFWNVLTRPATARGGDGLSVGGAERRLILIERVFIARNDAIAVASHEPASTEIVDQVIPSTVQSMP